MANSEVFDRGLLIFDRRIAILIAFSRIYWLEYHYAMNYFRFMNKIDLEERLISFSVSIIDMIQSLPETKANNHLGIQLLRSGTSTALNYGEAQGGESKRDFIHKIKIVLKELRESLVCLKIIQRSNQNKQPESLHILLRECNELVSIFVKSVQTAERNQLPRRLL